KTKEDTIGTKDDIAESIKIIPLEKIMLETDCPYLAPQELRGSRSEPAYVKYVAQKIAQIKGIEFSEISRVSDLNARKFFKLS
ncbi:MAG: TatD family hydrolase, partial [Candidatus Moranbacteria bacterium]|nr:TatD family hydrolase [Candidatus Moranbacteria bacterium]